MRNVNGTSVVPKCESFACKYVRLRIRLDTSPASFEYNFFERRYRRYMLRIPDAAEMLLEIICSGEGFRIKRAMKSSIDEKKPVILKIK